MLPPWNCRFKSLPGRHSPLHQSIYESTLFSTWTWDVISLSDYDVKIETQWKKLVFVAIQTRQTKRSPASKRGSEDEWPLNASKRKLLWNMTEHLRSSWQAKAKSSELVHFYKEVEVPFWNVMDGYLKVGVLHIKKSHEVIYPDGKQTQSYCFHLQLYQLNEHIQWKNVDDWSSSTSRLLHQNGVTVEAWRFFLDDYQFTHLKHALSL